MFLRDIPGGMWLVPEERNKEFLKVKLSANKQVKLLTPMNNSKVSSNSLLKSNLVCFQIMNEPESLENVKHNESVTAYGSGDLNHWNALTLSVA